MGKHNDQVEKEKGVSVQSVLEILKKQAALTVKQEKFCNSACVERFLKAKGGSAKKAAKQIRNCLAWRDSVGIDNLIADEFSAELAEGAAYVAGHDDEFRPIMIFRIKQDYHKFHSQKQFTRFLAFTIEVAVQTMARHVEQFVLLFDASAFKSASPFMNMLLTVLKIIADYYPGRLHKAFIIDPPSLFPLLWKGVKPFLDLSSLTTLVSSLDYCEDSLQFNGMMSASSSSLYQRPASMRFDYHPSSKPESCSSSRFSFTVSHHFDSVKPWYLSLTRDNSSAAKVGPTGPAISPHNSRSFSFAAATTSPAARAARGGGGHMRGFFPSTPMPQPTKKLDSSMIRHPRTPNPSFIHSPALSLFRIEKSRELFTPYVKFYRRPYNEMIYRSKMAPPLGGLVSIVSSHLRRRHVSVSQRF